MVRVKLLVLNEERTGLWLWLGLQSVIRVKLQVLSNALVLNQTPRVWVNVIAMSSYLDIGLGFRVTVGYL